MLTNATRKQAIKRVDDKIARIGRVSPQYLIETIDEAARQAKTPMRMLAKCFELINFTAVYPNHEDVKRIAAGVIIACDPTAPLNERIFLINKLFKTTVNSDRTTMGRFPLMGLDKEHTEAIYRDFLQSQQTTADTRHFAEAILANAQNRETPLPDYFLRDIKIALNATLQGESDQVTAEDSCHGWAALQYLAKEWDAIPDSEGYLGLVDDMHVMRLASRKILPQLHSLEIVTAEVFQKLPFLNELRFNQRGQYGHHVSEYLIISSLPLFDKLLGVEKSIANISLVEDPTLHSISASLIMGFGVLSNFIAKSPERLRYEELTPHDTLEVGQEVTRRDDGTRWIFQGFTTIEEGGEEYIRLEAIGKNAGGSSLVRRSTPLVAKQGRARERIGGTYRLTAAELLFDLEKFDYNQYIGQQRIFLVCNRNKYEEHLENVLINDIPWRQSIPIGVIPSSRGTEFTDQIEVFSGGQASSVVLYLVPNIRTLIDYHFSGDSKLINPESIVIVDGSSEMSSLDRLDELRALGASVNVFASSVTHTHQFSQLLDQGFTSFRWDRRLLNAYKAIGPKGKGFQDWENTLERSLHQNVIPHPIPSTDADLIYQSTKRLDLYVKSSAEELNQHAQKMIEDGKELTLALLRLNQNCAADRGELAVRLLELNGLNEAIQSSRLINEEQLALLRTHLDIVRKHIAPALARKATHFSEVSKKLIKAKLFSANASSTIEKSLLPLESTQIRHHDECVLAYWPGQRRVARLVNSKPKTCFHVVLFQHELAWLRAFRKNYYATPTPETVYERLRVASEMISDAGATEFGDEEAKHLAALKQAALGRSHDADERLARANILIYAEGENVIFASVRSQFSVVVSTSGKSKLAERPGAQIQAGDQLAYLPGSERGAIRATADRIFLEPGTRELATSWRSALHRFFESSNLTTEALHHQLVSAGVQRGIDTIEDWLEDEDRIYPTDAANVIPRIFKVVQEVKSDDEIAAILHAIGLVKSAHSKASDYLENILVEEMNNYGSSARKLRVLEVIAVEHCDHLVPYRLLSQPQSINNI
jgi:uncharacterized membrane protein YkvA (DUF1232 family)